MIWIIVGVVVLLLIAAVVLYNRLVSLRNRVENAWAQVDVQLKRRYDLIPNLVETVKGYAAHERETFEAVTAARTRAQQAQGPAEQGAAEGILGQALGRLFAVAEAYPELQADENFRQLQEELAQTENRIAVSRQVYNDTVLTYNTAIQTGPGQPLRRAVRLHAQGLLRGGGRGPGGATRRVLALAASAAAALALAGDAAAKSFSLPAADVTVQIQQDGTLVVDEVIVFSFSGDFSGAYREIPLREGESLDQVFVSEGEQQYQPGGCAELQCSSPPGTFGTARTDKGVRIVWHYSASNEERRFRVHYRLRGLAVAYDDVVDVNLQVWGDEWEVGLDQLTAAMIAPGDVLRAWGHPVGVRGDVTIDGPRVDLRARADPRRPVRRAAHGRPAAVLHLHGGHAGRRRARPAEDRGRGARGRSRIRARPAQDRRRARQSRRDDREAARDRAPPRARRDRLRLVALGPRARDQLRPRVRAGAADRDAARARAGPARAGRCRRARSSSRRRSST